MQAHDDLMRDQSSVLGVLSLATKRLLHVVFRQTKPANQQSRHLTPDEIATFQHEMHEHDIDDETPPLRRKQEAP